jgi:hypothetical protein
LALPESSFVEEGIEAFVPLLNQRIRRRGIPPDLMRD